MIFGSRLRSLISCTTHRYIALRFSTPIPRKKAKVSRANAKRERTASANSSESFESTSGGVLRPGKKIVGFILAELDVSLDCIRETTRR